MGLDTFAYRSRPGGWVIDGDLTAASGIVNASQRDVAISGDGKIVALARSVVCSAVALGLNGKILAVGAPFDPSAATGIDGDRDDASMPERGAVWLY